MMGERNRGRRPRAARRSRRGAGALNALAPLFHRLLDRIDRGLEVGAIEASLPNGTARLLGGRAHGPVAIVAVHDWRALIRLATGGSAGWYEGWAAGDWSSPDPVPLFDLFMRNRIALGGAARASSLSKFLRRAAHWARRNTPSNARKNIAYHYDLGNDFYLAWLDPGMTYSSAIFTPGLSLEAAQEMKLARMLERTGAGPGDRILELGCGWGSFAEAAVGRSIDVHGITLSTEQRDYAAARVPEGARFTLTDYRDVSGTYDAIASIEMVEAVGQDYWRDYLRVVARSLKPGGRAAIQFIAIDDAIFEKYAESVDFIQAYVFPGGMLLSERAFAALAQTEGLAWRDREAFGASYAETLRQWRARFDAAVDEGRVPAEFDEDFIALWRYYLMYCEGGFRGRGIDVAQVTLSRS